VIGNTNGKTDHSPLLARGGGGEAGTGGEPAAGSEAGGSLSVALVGNPNCGKTSLFNFASGAREHVGNYSGVTVDAKTGHVSFEDYDIELVDLPGTYSLSAYSPEELYVRKQIMEDTPDVVINVIDTSNLERNLYLTTQLIDMDIPMVCALNMFDETENRGDNIDLGQLSTLFGVPMVPTVFTTGRGIDQLLRTVVAVAEGTETTARHLHINHGTYIEAAIEAVQSELKKTKRISRRFSTRYIAIKLLEYDKETEKWLASMLGDTTRLYQTRDKAAEDIRQHLNEDSETAIMDAKYGFIHGALQEAEYQTGNKKDVYQATHLIDNILTNRYVGIPLFIAMMWLMFETTFSLGQYPMDWIDMGVGWIGDRLQTLMPEGPLKDMLIDGVVGGVGAVIVFLPQILILYAFISFMEDSGYMARAAFIMDKLMHRIGLHGKSFIPLVMGFGCNVPAVMATRTIESRRSRLITMLILPFMSCSARLPIYIMIIGTVFAPRYQSSVMISLYVVGILTAALMSRLFSKVVFKGEDTPFVMELPPYRVPTWKAMLRHTWEKGKQYLKKMGGIILVASIIVWALGYFPHNDSLSKQQQQEQSYIGHIGKGIEPVFRPQGFDWKLDVAILSGVGAKEIVASTMGVLYNVEESGEALEESGERKVESGEWIEESGERRVERGEVEKAGGFQGATVSPLAQHLTPVTAYAFLLFVLLYFPCIATIAAIKSETGSWRWALFTALYTTAIAWAVSALFYQVATRI
ncbi:MAG: ferrous iron transport protein B, partial [Prevotella sp.]|nr:ferrous iron transport protein B [Prevotella sp.]